MKTRNLSTMALLLFIASFGAATSHAEAPRGACVIYYHPTQNSPIVVKCMDATTETQCLDGWLRPYQSVNEGAWAYWYINQSCPR